MNNLVGVGSVSTVFRKVQTIKALALGPAMSFIFLLGGLGLAFFNVMVLMFKSSFFLFFFFSCTVDQLGLLGEGIFL